MSFGRRTLRTCRRATRFAGTCTVSIAAASWRMRSARGCVGRRVRRCRCRLFNGDPSLRAQRRDDQRRLEGSHRRGVRDSPPRFPAAGAKRRSLSLVPGEWPAPNAVDDPHGARTLGAACRTSPVFDSLLGSRRGVVLGRPLHAKSSRHPVSDRSRRVRIDGRLCPDG
jgi:hypothetical protein